MPTLHPRPEALGRLARLVTLTLAGLALGCARPSPPADSSPPGDGGRPPEAASPEGARDAAPLADATARSGDRPADDGLEAARPPPDPANARDGGGAGAEADADGSSLMAELVGRIQETEVRALLGTLQEMSVPNRATGTESYRRVTEWIRELVGQRGPALSVRFEEQGGFRNVEITLPASDPGAGMFILGGHLDSVERSPGIDDNGSGSLGTVLVALALGHYRFRSQMRFVLFDAEEEGLLGSALYARNLRAGGCAPGSCLRYFMNMDMIGHDPDKLGRVEIYTALSGIFDLLRDVARAQQLGLDVVRGGTARCNSSDDCSFSQAGYDAAYVFEAKYLPQRHTPRDTVDVINFDTMTRTLKLVAATLATSAEMQGRR